MWKEQAPTASEWTVTCKEAAFPSLYLPPLQLYLNPNWDEGKLSHANWAEEPQIHKIPVQGLVWTPARAWRAEALTAAEHLAHCLHHYYRKNFPSWNKSLQRYKWHTTVFHKAKTQCKFQNWAANTPSTRLQLITSVKHLQSRPLAWLTSKTSSSNILVPNTMMPLTSMMGWSLRSKNLVIFFLQSKIKVTFFFCTLIATLCHLEEQPPDVLNRALGFQEQANNCITMTLSQTGLQIFMPATICKHMKTILGRLWRYHLK